MTIKDLIINKAQQSNCCYRIAAIGLNRKGEIVAVSINQHRFPHHGGGIHAEMVLMRKHPKSLRKIIIGRIGRSNELRPISPCSSCYKKSLELGIKIIAIKPDYDY